MAELTANSRGPKQRSVYLITYSQCDSSHLSRTQFADIIVDAWHSISLSKILQWVVSLESHQNGGSHFHMAIKLNTTSRWRAIRRFVDNKHGIKLNFSDSHTNYYTAYEYVTKEDPNFVLSPGHPDLANTSTPILQMRHVDDKVKRLQRLRNPKEKKEKGWQFTTLCVSYKQRKYRRACNLWP